MQEKSDIKERLVSLVVNKHKDQLSHILIKRFESEVESGCYTDAVRIIDHLYWLFYDDWDLHEQLGKIIKDKFMASAKPLDKIFMVFFP